LVTIPQVLALVTYSPPRSTAGGIVTSSELLDRQGAFMRARKRFDDLPWETIVIALALSAIVAWSLGWIAGTIVTVIAGR
jgi:hypothetical protein